MHAYLNKKEYLIFIVHQTLEGHAVKTALEIEKVPYIVAIMKTSFV